MTLLELMHLMRKHLGIMIVVPAACSALVALVCLFLPDTYTASTTMYVLSRSDQSTQTTMSSDLTASQMLTNDVASILKSNRVQSDVAKEVGLQNLNDFDVSINNSSTTRVITLSVTGKDPDMAAAVANALVSDTSAVAQEVMNVQSVNVIDAATSPSSPSGPRRAVYSLVGLVVGFFAAMLAVVIQSIVDTRVHDSREAEDILDLPVIGHYPDVSR